jgi:Caspase domain
MTRGVGVRASLWLVAMITSVAVSIAAGAQERNPDRVALVIGNSKYVNVNVLANAANDARVMSRALRDIGFAVTDGFDLPRDGMERQIREFLRKSETARVRLFYYAGHGLQVDGRNYLVPVNTKLESASDLSFETIGLDTILESLDSTSRTNIIILDACRNNPFAQTFASRYGAGRSVTVQPGLAGYSSLGAGMLIAFSTAPGAVALDGNGANSPFTEALARHMRTPGLEVRQMLTRVRADVASETSGKQIPWDNSALLGDVYLAGIGRTEISKLDIGGGKPGPDRPGPDKQSLDNKQGPGKPEPPHVAVVPLNAGPRADDLLWGTIKDSSVAAVFDEFVSKFPNSPHAREARGRADELKREASKKDEQKKTEVAMLPPGAGAQIGNLANTPANAPIASFTRHNGGWSVAFSFAEPVTGISWRLGEAGTFRETGFLDVLDPRTRRRMPNPGIQLDADQRATTIFVRYIDANGAQQGPFPIRFEPAGALEREQRKILEMTTGSWLMFREFNGLMLYYTHLVSYRCAIRQIRIGIDSTIPDRPLVLPPCNEKEPMAIPADVQPWLKLPPATAMVSVELTYRDGSVSEVKTFRK